MESSCRNRRQKGSDKWRAARNRRQEESGHREQLETEDKMDQSMKNSKEQDKKNQGMRTVKYRKQEASGHLKEVGTEDKKDQGIANSEVQKTKRIMAWRTVGNVQARRTDGTEDRND